MKILVVDDEINIRESMSNYIAKLDLGFECIEIAESGKDGLEKALRLKPDIIVSDIVIPEFNGLELIQRVKNQLPHCRFIMISGHDDVEYFKESIKLDVVDYILKPIKPLELKKALIKSIQIIKTEKKRLLLTDQLKKYIQDNTPVIKHHYLKMILCQNTISNTDIHQMKLIDFKVCNSNNIVLSNILVDIKKEGNSESDFQIFEHQMMIEQALKDQSEAHHLNFEILWEEPNDVIVLFYGINNSISKHKILKFYENFMSILQALDFNVFISISDNIDHINDVSEHYKKLKKANKNKLLTGYNSIIFSSDTYMLDYTDQSYSKEFNNLLAKFNLDNDHDTNADFDAIKMDIAIEILIALHSLCKENAIDYQIDYSQLFNLSTIYEFNRFYHDNWMAIEDILARRRASRTENIINYIVNYIDEHYTQNIGVSTIADYIKISPNYCGALFKEQKGEKINHYINKVRIQKACELIESTDYTISAISQMVGYVSNGYFTKLFKKYIGYTPSEYKEKTNRKREL